jgi:hypothetical protein
MNPRAKQSTSDLAVCPLSDSQQQKSIETFSKMVPTFNEEPRCLNCHGAVDPFRKFEPPEPDSCCGPTVEHGGGNDMDHPVFKDGKLVSGTDCNSCHDNMVHKGRWEMAPEDDRFLGQNAQMLCGQMRTAFQEAQDFINHLENDDFILTGFVGNRGLDEGAYPEIPPQRPRINHADFVTLGKDWVATTGGEFKGDWHCGCEPTHYAIRVTSSTEINMGPTQYHSLMQPIDIPITFEDHGTFSGESEANFGAAAAVSTKMGVCAGQSTDSLKIRVSGQATEQFQNNSMHLQLENTSPDVTNFSAQCPKGAESKQNTHLEKVLLPFELTGKVGETIDRPMPVTIRGFVSTMHLTIVQRW